MDIEVRKLGEDCLEDFLDFFDNRAFCDNPDWGGCYCCFFYYSDDREFESRPGTANREEAVSRIRAGEMNGYMAFLDGKAVGWCNADDIGNFPRIIEDPNIEPAGDKRAAAVVCFTIDHNYRRKGIAKALLEKVCGGFEDAGYDFIEAYPGKSPGDDAGNYHGPLSMYLKSGFKIQKELEDFYIVRKLLENYEN